MCDFGSHRVDFWHVVVGISSIFALQIRWDMSWCSQSFCSPRVTQVTSRRGDGGDNGSKQHS